MDLCVLCGNYVSGNSHVCNECLKKHLEKEKFLREDLNDFSKSGL